MLGSGFPVGLFGRGKWISDCFLVSLSVTSCREWWRGGGASSVFGLSGLGLVFAAGTKEGLRAQADSSSGSPRFSFQLPYYLNQCCVGFGPWFRKASPADEGSSGWTEPVRKAPLSRTRLPWKCVPRAGTLPASHLRGLLRFLQVATEVLLTPAAGAVAPSCSSGVPFWGPLGPLRSTLVGHVMLQ